MTDKWYTVKVIEKHSDVVTIRASSAEEAKNRAIAEAECTFDCTYDCEVLSVSDGDVDGQS